MGFEVMDNDSALDMLIDISAQPVFLTLEDGTLIKFNKAAADSCADIKEGSMITDLVCGRNHACSSCPAFAGIPLQKSQLFTGAGLDHPCSFSGVLFTNVSYKSQPALLSVWKFDQQADAHFCVGYLDLDSALDNFGGSYVSFREILIVYYNVGADKCSLIRRLYDERDYHNLRIEVHGLKSTSYVIGAKTFGDFAKSLEFACKDIEAGNDSTAREFIDSNIDTLLDDYSKLLNSISPLVCNPSDASANSGEKRSDEEITDLINKALAALEDYDLETASEFVDKLDKTLLPEDKRDSLTKVIEGLKNFDYDNTAAILRSML